jgi:hypothetical protein
VNAPGYIFFLLPLLLPLSYNNISSFNHHHTTLTTFSDNTNTFQSTHNTANMASKSSPEKEKPTQEKPKLPKVVWTPDADKALLSNLLDHIVVGEIDGKMWHSIAYLMGGEAQGFTHDKIR